MKYRAILLDRMQTVMFGIDGIWINPAGRPARAGLEPVAELSGLTALPRLLSAAARDG